MFQFQTGSIKRSDVKILKSGKGFWFQFQTGSIKRNLSTSAAVSCILFQFQTGSIKRAGNSGLRYSDVRFNSKLVRLKAMERFARKPLAKNVSIPNWFD